MISRDASTGRWSRPHQRHAFYAWRMSLRMSVGPQRCNQSDPFTTTTTPLPPLLYPHSVHLTTDMPPCIYTPDSTTFRPTSTPAPDFKMGYGDASSDPYGMYGNESYCSESVPVHETQNFHTYDSPPPFPSLSPTRGNPWAHLTDRLLL